MESMVTALGLLGILITLSGLATEFVAVAAMGYWPLRRRLPSPFALLSWSGIAFYIGVAVLAAAQSLRQNS
jgi:hypothetical protein